MLLEKQMSRKEKHFLKKYYAIKIQDILNLQNIESRNFCPWKRKKKDLK